jgi:hypothetical protein
VSTLAAIDQAVRGLGSAAAAARAMGVSRSHLSRVRAGKAGIGPEASLLLSGVTGRSPLDGLREDGHPDLAEALERLGAFEGRGRTRRISASSRLDALTPADQEIVIILIKHLSERRGAKR